MEDNKLDIKIEYCPKRYAGGYSPQESMPYNFDFSLSDKDDIHTIGLRKGKQATMKQVKYRKE